MAAYRLTALFAATALLSAPPFYFALGQETPQNLKSELRQIQADADSLKSSEELSCEELLERAHSFIHRPDGERDLFQALQYLDRAIAAARKSDDPAGMLEAQYHRGVVYANALMSRGQDSGKGKEADGLLRKLGLESSYAGAKESLSYVAEHSKDLRQRTFALHFAANTAQAMGNFDDALEYLGKIEPQAVNSSQGYDPIVIGVLKARVLYAAGKKDEAAAELKSAYQLALREDSPKEYSGSTARFLGESVGLAKKIINEGKPADQAKIEIEKEAPLADTLKRLNEALP